MTLVPGTTIGRYQIAEPLGQGGMAVVYKAYQPSLERTVALKVIRRGFAEDAEFRERFAREAKAVARLSHPYIVQVFDYDEVEGQLFLAMQYLEGGTLKARLAALAEQGGVLEDDEALRILGQVAEALAYAHGEDIVHRDIKPANVMLTRSGSAVVTDFGIAKIVGGTSHTQTGVGIGTPEYMSPEQGQALPLDGRADQYSLAVMAFEMLTGRLPYQADTPLAVVLKHLRDPLPLPSSLRPDLGPGVDRVLLRGLAKEPADRYASTTDLVDALAVALRERPGRTLPTVLTPRRTPGAATRPHAPPARRGPALDALFARPALLALGGLALLLVGGGGAATVLGAFATTAPTPTPRAAIAVETTAPPTASPTPTATAPPTASPTPSLTPTPSPTPSPTVAVVITPTPTAAPTSVVAATCDTSAAAAVYGTVLWGSTRVAGARVEVRTSGTLKAAGTTGADGTYHVCGIPLGQGPYEISVTQAPYRPSTVSYGSLSAGRETFITDTYLIGTVSGLSVATSAIVPAGPLTLTWDAAPSATGYRVGFASGPNYASRCDSWAPFAVDARTVTSGRSYTTTALTPGTLYKIVVVAVSGTLEVAEASVCFGAG